MSPPAGSIMSNKNDPEKRASFALPSFPKLKMNKQMKFNDGSAFAPDMESAGLFSVIDKVQQSNNQFNNMFKNCSANFKSPIQKKLAVLVNAGN